VIEAAALASGLHIVIDALEAEVQPAGFDAWASGVWAAIGDAVDEDDVSRSKGEEPSGDLFRHVRVFEANGSRVVVDARPPMVLPVGGPPYEPGPTKFDDVDWHEGSAAEAGQPREHAFAHIGVYLGWLIRHDLHDPRYFPPEHLAGVKDGSMTGSDLADDVDWKLLSDNMTSEGSDFTAARYDAYFNRYNELLGEDADYRRSEDDSLYRQVEPLIDELYAEWVIAGRPAPDPPTPTDADAAMEAMFDAAEIPWDELAENADGPVWVQVHVDGSYEVEQPETPHRDADLEALIPPDAVEPPVVMRSVTATQWGSSLLNRALKRLGVRPREATVASGIGTRGAIVVTVYRVPGAPASRLMEEFGSVIYKPPRARWSERTVGSTTVLWAEGPVESSYFRMAYWAREEVVFHVAGEREAMEAMIIAIAGEPEIPMRRG
jgi:hypothetical protein